MKNGDPRSPAWIARHLKRFQRDNQVTCDMLELVSLRTEVSLEEITGWTDAQCLLAEDWAWAVHLSASDNNNRVPAVPDHLKERR